MTQNNVHVYCSVLDWSEQEIVTCISSDGIYQVFIVPYDHVTNTVTLKKMHISVFHYLHSTRAISNTSKADPSIYRTHV